MIETIAEIQEKRKLDKEYREIEFYPGDGCLFETKGDRIFLYLTSPEKNPILQFPRESITSLEKTSTPKSISPAYFIPRIKGSELQGNVGTTKFDISPVYIPNASNFIRNTPDGGLRLTVKTASLVAGQRKVQKEYGRLISDLFETLHGSQIFGKKGIAALLDKTNPGFGEMTLFFPNLNNLNTIFNSQKPGSLIACVPFLSKFSLASYVGLYTPSINDSRFYSSYL